MKTFSLILLAGTLISAAAHANPVEATGYGQSSTFSTNNHYSVAQFYRLDAIEKATQHAKAILEETCSGLGMELIEKSIVEKDRQVKLDGPTGSWRGNFYRAQITLAGECVTQTSYSGDVEYGEPQSASYGSAL